MDSSLFLTPVGLVPRTTSTPLSKSARKTKKVRSYVRDVCDTCEACGKEYRCKRAFRNHVRGHKIIEQSSRFPKVQEIIEHLSSNCGNIFHKMKESPAYEAMGEKYKAFVQLVIEGHESWAHFDAFKLGVHAALVRGLQDKKFLMPSSLGVIVQMNAEVLLSDQEERSNLRDHVKLCCAIEENIFELFLPSYVLHLVTDIVVFIRASLTATVTLSADKLFEMSNDYLETIHYVAGSKVRAFFKKSQRFSGSKAWKNIGRVISERFLESDTIPGPPASVKGWTAAQSRGRLFYVSGVLFDFFCGIASVLENQKNKLKVNYEDVVQKVCESGIVLLWDDAVSDSMTAADSYNFMTGMITAFCQTFGSGKVKRLVNELKPKGEASIALRHKVAPKAKSIMEPSTSK